MIVLTQASPGLVARDIVQLCLKFPNSSPEQLLSHTASLVSRSRPAIGRRLSPLPRRSVGAYDRLKCTLFALADTWAESIVDEGKVLRVQIFHL